MIPLENIKQEQNLVKRGFINIVFLGLVSLFIDLSTEMVYPLVTIYLSTFASVQIIGVIEGAAESLAALLKVYSGYLGDKFHFKKRLAFLGYSSAIFYKILLFFSFGWVGVFFAKLVDRIGKGIRTAPRDALVAESGEQALGKAFGIHKMLDMLGSALGVLIAFFLYGYLVNENQGLVDVEAFKKIFLISIIPAVIGVIFLLFVRETKKERKEVHTFHLKGIKIDSKLKFYIGIVLLFSIGNSSNAFLILKIYEIGFSPQNVLLLYLIYNVTTSLFAIPLGKLSDKIGRRRLVVPGYLLYGIVYFGFALFETQTYIIILFILYGLYQAFITGAEKAYISEYSPKEMKGTMLGLYGTAQGIGLLFASLIAGFLWTVIGPNAPFVLGGITGIVSAVLTFIVMSKKTKKLTEVK